MKNRFQVLEGESNEVRYEKFVKANKEAMEEVVPKKPKKKAERRSSHPSVIKARKEASDAQSTWEADKSDGNHEAWKQALRNLYIVYDQTKEQEIE